MNTLYDKNIKRSGSVRYLFIALLALACLAPAIAAPPKHAAKQPGHAQSARGDFDKNLACTMTIRIVNKTLDESVAAVCGAAGIPYRHDKSVELSEPEMLDVNISLAAKDKTAAEVLEMILDRTTLQYDLTESGLYLYRFGKEPEKGMLW